MDVVDDRIVACARCPGYDLDEISWCELKIISQLSCIWVILNVIVSDFECHSKWGIGSETSISPLLLVVTNILTADFKEVFEPSSAFVTHTVQPLYFVFSLRADLEMEEAHSELSGMIIEDVSHDVDIIRRAAGGALAEALTKHPDQVPVVLTQLLDLYNQQNYVSFDCRLRPFLKCNFSVYF